MVIQQKLPVTQSPSSVSPLFMPIFTGTVTLKRNNIHLSRIVILKRRYYENHRTVKWARIFASLPRPLSSTAPPTFFDEFRYRYHATPQWNMSRAGRVYERG